MKTIRRMMAALFAVLLTLAFSTVLFASDTDVAGRYDAVSCEKDGSSFQCDGEYLLLDKDGKGEILFNGVVYSLNWKADGTSLSFTDEDGEDVTGRVEDDIVYVKYYDYDYVFVRDESSLGGSIDEGAEDSDAQNTPAAADNAVKETESAVSVPDLSSVPVGSQEGPAVYVISNRQENGTPVNKSGEESVWRYDYIALNDDGSGVFLYNKAAFGIRWKQDGTAFSFTDHLGNEFTGEKNGETITGVYGKYRYTFAQTGATLPVYTLSPDDWEKGLALVVDEADVLSNEQEQEFAQKAQALADQYDVGVYLVFVNERDDYTWSGDVTTLSEEIRAGYSIGIGPTEKKAKHEENTNPDWKDSLLLTIAVNERNYDICVSGDYANWAFPKYGREKIRDAFLDYLHNNDWSGAARSYLAGADKVLSVAAKGKPFSFKTDTAGRVIGILVPALLALLFGYGITAVKKSSMQNTQKAKNAASYIATDKVNFTRREDRYIRTLVSRTYSPKDKGGSGGGGSFSSSSGSSHTSGSF